LTSDLGNEKESFQKLIDKIKEEKISINVPENGSRIDVGEYLDFEVLSPDSDNSFKDTNDNSIVARLFFVVNCFLITGDAGEKTEEFLIKENINFLDVDWLKVAHHGSKNSSSEDFLEKVTPEFSVISSGKENRYGHPAPETLSRIENVGGEFFRTDKLGSIIVACEMPQRDSCSVK
jgi:competence protein ComEC